MKEYKSWKITLATSVAIIELIATIALGSVALSQSALLRERDNAEEASKELNKEIKSDVRKISEEVSKITSAISGIVSRIDGVEKRFDIHEARQNNVARSPQFQMGN
jgi:hypothetical protein